MQQEPSAGGEVTGVAEDDLPARGLRTCFDQHSVDGCRVREPGAVGRNNLFGWHIDGIGEGASDPHGRRFGLALVLVRRAGIDKLGISSADRALHIEENHLPALDTLGVARMLAAAVAAEKPDLVLTGLQSDDLGAGQTGVVMAELLGVPHATIIMHVEVEGAALRVKRELEDGWFQNIGLPLPAVLTIQSGINKLRYATLMGIKRAKTKEIKRLTATDLGVAPAPSVAVIEKVYPPAKTKQAQIFEGDARSAAAKLVEKLKYEARIL